MKRIALIAAALFLAAPGGALAKGGEARAIRVCGSDRCVTLTDRTQIQIVLSIGAYGTGHAPRGQAPFYTISTVPPTGRKPLYRYVPSAGVAGERPAEGGAWLVVPQFVRELLYAEATRRLQPFSAGTEHGFPTTALVVAGAAAAIFLSSALAARRRSSRRPARDRSPCVRPSSPRATSRRPRTAACR